MSQVSTDNSHRSLHVEVHLSGVMDRDIPQRVVDAISEAQGRDFQKHSLLRGNARMAVTDAQALRRISG